MVHLVRFRSRYAHSENFCSLLICRCIFNSVSEMIAKSSTHVVV
jgi:hypothetical protein